MTDVRNSKTLAPAICRMRLRILCSLEKMRKRIGLIRPLLFINAALLTLFSSSSMGDSWQVVSSSKNARGDQIDVVSQDENNTNSQITVWRITQPQIAQRGIEYPQVKFLPGDRFKVLAGGCDQTGGIGKTWKRYVNPQGPNTNSLYHGTIWVPNALPVSTPDPFFVNFSKTNSAFADYRFMSRLSDFGVGDGLMGGEPVEHYIPDPLPNGDRSNSSLWLGFEDDGYDDNGYYSRDNGDNDQCVNVPTASVIITIGHHGALPPDPRLYVGIKPADFRCQGAWRFVNQGTPVLSYASFQTAFQISWAGKYFWLPNEILFMAGRHIAASGNCEGMALLSVAGEDQFIVGDIDESFWHNYQYGNFLQAPPNVQFDINVAHWQQLSAYFIHNWLESIESDASTIVSRVEHDLSVSQYNYVYGLLTLLHGSSGHVVVPIAVTHDGAHTYIQAYNPDTPCVSIPDTANYPKIDIVGNHWSYDMGSDGVWSGDNGALGLASNGMGYIAYHGPDDGWTNPISSLDGIVQVIFGAGVSVDQVSDSKGRKLIVAGKLDFSDRGLARTVIKVPFFVDTEKAQRPRSGDKNKVMKVDREKPGSPAQMAMLQKIDHDYANDYADAGVVYLVRGTDLTDLTFSLSSNISGKSVRALFSSGDKFIEVKTEPTANGQGVHPSFILHDTANFEAAGITARAGVGNPLKVSFTDGRYDVQKKSETLQVSSALIVKTALKAQLQNDDLDILTSDAVGPETVEKTTIAADASITHAPARKFTTKPIP